MYRLDLSCAHPRLIIIDYFVFLGNNYWAMQGLLETVNRHAVGFAVGIYQSKLGVLTKLNHMDQQQAVAVGL